MKVIAFNGSPRKNGNTSILINIVLDELKQEGIETELIQLGGRQIHGCRACFKCVDNQDQRCAQDDDILNELLAKMLEADGIIFGSPTHYGNITPEMSALINRSGLVSQVNGALFRRKVGAAVVAVRRAGSVHAIGSVHHMLLLNQMIIPGSSYWNMAVGFDKGDVEKDEEGIATMKTLGQNMAWLLKKLNS
ncbi:MAG: flavodoxin family protein [Dehalococcoidia bacterium]|nr:MAG: flavodoxin family protein [Dehalococcoidia bacterium]